MQDRKASRKDWRLILSLGASALGILYFLIQVFALGVIWLTGALGETSVSAQNISVGLLAWSSLLSGVLLIPVFLLSLYELRGQPIPHWLDTSRPEIGKWIRRLIVIWPLIVFLGWWVASKPSLIIFLLGPINLLAAGLPVLWIYSAARWKLDGGSQMRQWRILGFSLTLTPVVVILAEIFALLILSGFGGLWFLYRISINPQIEIELNHISNQIITAGGDLDSTLELLKPYITQPGVIVWVMVIFGGVVPLIEEVLKPLALWSLSGRKISAQEGFVGGLLCGAGFALMENILYLAMAVSPGEWLFVTIGRAGTGVLHMMASGLVGWGLARTWRDGKWVFLGLTTLSAFILHGLWNVLALASGVAPLFLNGSEPGEWRSLLFNLPVIFLLTLLIIGIVLINKHFRNNEQEPSRVGLIQNGEERQNADS